MKLRLFIIPILIFSILAAQAPLIETIRTNTISQYTQIKDYQVDIKISVKMTGFRMPKKKIKLYYKNPDKMKVETRGFAILPKTGVGGNPNEFLDMLSHVTDIENTTLNGKAHYKITGEVNRDSLKIPVEVQKDKIPNISMIVFVNAEKWVITQVGVYLNSESVFTINTDYTEVKNIMMPKQSIFRIGVKGISRWTTQNPFDFGGPGSDRQEFEHIAKNAGFDPEKDEFIGEMVMQFSKYKVNEGIDDSIFTEDN